MSDYTVVIRCKNEAMWLPDLNRGLELQSIHPKAVIFVDSGSSDGSIELAKSFGWSIVNYPKSGTFNYSKSLNLGIHYAETEYVLLLSAHCLPASKQSIFNLLSSASTHGAAGVFGRQLPTANSSPFDARDLLTVFGRERIVYHTHPFFHNAFSLIKKSIWNNYKFNENINGIEDRLWAKVVCDEGYKIVYEPEACVYHEHGLNQSQCKERATRVLKALTYLHLDDEQLIHKESFESNLVSKNNFISYESCKSFTGIY